MPMITGTTRLYAIIGDPIAHVRTPTSFNERFATLGIDAICVPIQIPADRFDAGLHGLKAMPNLDGFIVTAPHKASVIPFCDEIEPGAKLVGAVNTVRREPDGRYIGTMLDGRGFVQGLKAEGRDPRGQSIFICGAGGVASAISFALAEAGIARITLRDRTLARAESLAARIAAAYPACKVGVGDAPAGHDIALNATPVGLQAEDPLPFEIGELSPGMLVAEVLMKPPMTALLVAAAEAGHPIHQGRHMLDHQLGLMFDFLKLEQH
jgi:shikimate dehydrogenase